MGVRKRSNRILNMFFIQSLAFLRNSRTIDQQHNCGFFVDEGLHHFPKPSLAQSQADRQLSKIVVGEKGIGLEAVCLEIILD